MKASLALPGLLAALTGACAGAPKAVVYDLASRTAVAERSWSRELVLFGTPAAEPREAEGFFRWPGGRGDRFVWARRDVEVALSWDRSEERAAVLDLQPFRGVPDQKVAVLLNGRPVEHLALNAYRHRYRIALPAAAQREGENRLRFEFAGTASAAELDPGRRDPGQLAAAFYSLAVGAAGDPLLEDLLARDAPRPFAQVEDAGVPALVLPGGGAARFAIEAPSGAELRFTPALHPSVATRGGAAILQVTLETAPGRERTLWSRRLDVGARPPEEVVVPLPVAQGSALRLGLRVAGAPDERRAWAVWRAPRVLGREARARATAPYPPAEASGLARGLKERLAGLNVVLVILDAARAEQIGAYGYRRPTTPEIDRIAAEGVLFEQAFTPAVYTVGAMSSLWTSQHPDQHHADTSFAARLPKDRLTLAELLTGRGIATAGFVANAMAGKALGFDRGFAEFREVFGHEALGSRAEVFREVLPGFLRGHRDRRFFAYLHFREPHFPFDPPPPFDTLFGFDEPLPPEARHESAWYVSVNRGERRPTDAEIDHLRRLYDGNLAYADREVGFVRDALQRSALLERSVIVIAADHGEQLHEHGYISHSAQLYEQSLRVPLIVRFPAGRGPAGVRVHEPVDLTDVAPTIADVFGVRGEAGSAREFEGRSLLPVALGAPARAAVLSRTVWDRPLYAIRGDRFKLIRNSRTSEEQLFDLFEDPGERRDISAREPLRAALMREELLLWLGQLRGRRASSGEAASITPEQCENMRALGYVDSCR